MCLDPAMEEAPKKRYVAYKMSKNIEANKKAPVDSWFSTGAELRIDILISIHYYCARVN
jgi:hypothetical protein